MTGEQIVAEARRWLGTPYQHKGRIIGRCADCAAPIIGVVHACGLTYEERMDYGRVPNPRRMREELERNLIRVPIPEARDGDVLFLSWKERPHHLAIKTPVGMLHAYNLMREVVEHPISDEWAGRIRGVYRIPGVT